ncbi:MAG TPA: hypothetical protein VH815_10345 [Acidobacteriota bacterium]|jgi:hypothetical protein
MKEIKNRKQNPTKEESRAALESQAPLQRISTFKQLAKVSRSARIAFGNAATWVKPEMLFRADYRDGLESPPFFVTKAFRYTRKATDTPGLGLEIVFADGKPYNVGLNLNDSDSKRNNILDAFSQPNVEPIGPFVMIQLDLGKGNPYYDLQPYEQEKSSSPDVTIPFIEIDEDIPF